MNWKLIRHIDELTGIPLVQALRLARRPAARVRRSVFDGDGPILAVKFWGIGNLFLMAPALRTLQQRYPGLAIDLLTLEPNREAAGLLGLFRTIHTVSAERSLGFIRTASAALRTIRRMQYGLVIDFEQFARFSALLSDLSGGRSTIGFMTAGQRRHHLYSRAVPYDNTLHVARSYSMLIEAAGAGPLVSAEEGNALTGLSGSRCCRTLLERQNIAGRAAVVLHVGTSDNFPERRWPTESFAELADLLIDRAGAAVVLTGLAGEGDIAARVLAAVRNRAHVVNAVGTIDFPAFFELIRESDLVVSADTAAVHVASEAGTAVIGLYGPNTPVLYGPWGPNGAALYKKLECSPCITNFNAKIHVCRHPDGKGVCMKRIRPLEVFTAAAAWLAAAKQATARREQGDACFR